MFKYLKDGDPQINLNIAKVTCGHILEGKNVLITGGGRGLGYAIAKKCVSEGAQVIITGRNEQTLKSAAESLGNRCKYVVWDIEDLSRMDSFFCEVNECIKNGYINVLINNAGISNHETSYEVVTKESWDAQFDINLKGVYFLTQRYIQYLQEMNGKSANIVMISSERGLAGDTLPYGLTKAAINSFVQGLSKHYISRGIRINAVAPGVTASDMTGVNEKSNLYHSDSINYRYFIADEVAEVVSFLISDASNCISGEVIACDQGNYLSRNWRV
ncbi:MAG: SDR family oxidoreductase [Lachnospiraceae bacterium]|nr:SDR family oxidoreductase [Lachnospiraceae bacterium]